MPTPHPPPPPTTPVTPPLTPEELVGEVCGLVDLAPSSYRTGVGAQVISAVTAMVREAAAARPHASPQPQDCGYGCRLANGELWPNPSCPKHGIGFPVVPAPRPTVAAALKCPSCNAPLPEDGRCFYGCAGVSPPPAPAPTDAATPPDDCAARDAAYERYMGQRTPGNDYVWTCGRNAFRTGWDAGREHLAASRVARVAPPATDALTDGEADALNLAIDEAVQKQWIDQSRTLRALRDRLTASRGGEATDRLRKMEDALEHADGVINGVWYGSAMSATSHKRWQELFAAAMPQRGEAQAPGHQGAGKAGGQ